MIIGTWNRNQTNLITFVLVDAAYTEVPGLGNTFTLEISKAGGVFNPSAGTKAEISNGWYRYLATAGESDTIGPVSIRITNAAIIQQNLEYVVVQRTAGCIEFTYTVTNSVTLLPVSGVDVWITTDLAGAVIIWKGTTNVAGVALDDYGNLPCLDAGTYYFWKQRPGYIDDDSPDVESVS